MPQNKCVCAGKSVAERFALFSSQLASLVKAGTRSSRSGQILRKSGDCLIKLLCEIVLNILKGNIELPPQQYNQLKPYKRWLLALCDKKTSSKKKLRLIAEKLGTFLREVLPGVMSIVQDQWQEG
jgi:hypothetical protein